MLEFKIYFWFNIFQTEFVFIRFIIMNSRQTMRHKSNNYYYYLHVGIRSIAVGLSVYCSDSGPGTEQTKELQKKMKS